LGGGGGGHGKEEETRGGFYRMVMSREQWSEKRKGANDRNKDRIFRKALVAPGQVVFSSLIG